MKFYQLKRTLFFPQIAGFMRAMKDVPYLYDLLVHERGETRKAYERAYRHMMQNGLDATAQRLKSDWRMLDQAYEHDIALCAQFMLDNKVKPI